LIVLLFVNVSTLQGDAMRRDCQ